MEVTGDWFGVRWLGQVVGSGKARVQALREGKSGDGGVGAGG